LSGTARQIRPHSTATRGSLDPYTRWFTCIIPGAHWMMRSRTLLLYPTSPHWPTGRCRVESQRSNQHIKSSWCWNTYDWFQLTQNSGGAVSVNLTPWFFKFLCFFEIPVFSKNFRNFKNRSSFEISELFRNHSFFRYRWDISVQKFGDVIAYFFACEPFLVVSAEQSWFQRRPWNWQGSNLRWILQIKPKFGLACPICKTGFEA
jgi:hypothetical protein